MIARELSKEPLTNIVLDKLFDVGNIPPKFRRCTPKQVPDNVSYKSMLEDWTKNIKKYVDAGKWLIMYGPFGTGKTATAAMILRQVLLHNGSAFMMDQNELVDYKLNSANVSFGSFALEDVVKNSNILMLDDVGSGRDKDIVVELIEWVCVARYNHKKSLIITTNLDVYGSKIKQFFTGKVLSMFHEMGIILKMDEYEWRVEMGKEKENEESE